MEFETVLKDIQQQIKHELIKKGVPTWNLNYDTSQGMIKKSPSDVLFTIIHINHLINLKLSLNLLYPILKKLSSFFIFKI